MTDASCIHPERTHHVQCFHKHKDIQSIHPAHQVTKNYTTVQRGACSEGGSLACRAWLGQFSRQSHQLGFAWNGRRSGFSMCGSHINMDIRYHIPLLRQITQQPQRLVILHSACCGLGPHLPPHRKPLLFLISDKERGKPDGWPQHGFTRGLLWISVAFLPREPSCQPWVRGQGAAPLHHNPMRHRAQAHRTHENHSQVAPGR